MARAQHATEPVLVYHVLSRWLVRLPLFQENDDCLGSERVLGASLD